MRVLFRFLSTAVLSIAVASGASLSYAADAQVVKIGQIEAQTGPSATYGWMSAQGARLAVQQINEAGGFEVAGKKYKLELLQADTRGEPREAVVQFKKLMEDKVPFVFGPFLSNVYNAIEPIARQNDGKFLLFTGATAAHASLGTPKSSFLLRTFNWDGGQAGFGSGMVDVLKKRGVKKVAMLFQNDAFGKVAVDIYTKLFSDAGITLRVELFEPGTKDFNAALSKLAIDKPDYLFPGYSDGVLFDIVRQATEADLFRKFFTVRGSIAPALKNSQSIEEYIAYVPKYFEEAEKQSPEVAKFVSAYKAFYKREFPYDQAPLCASSCYDHVHMLVEAMKKAGTTSDIGAIRKQLLATRYNGLWAMTFDSTGEAVFDFDVIEVKRGGAITRTSKKAAP